MFKPASPGFSKWIAFLGLAVLLAACNSRYEGRIVGQWIDLLETGNTDEKNQAVTVLGKLGPKAEAAIPALIKALTGKDIKDKMPVSHTLGKSAAYALSKIDSAGHSLKFDKQ